MKGERGPKVLGDPRRTEDGQETPAAGEDDDWLALTQHMMKASTDYFESNFYKTWERNLAMFKGEHPPGSKYYTDGYKHRAKFFRPKTRSAVKRAEAAAAVAFFSTDDIVSIQAEDSADPKAVLAAEIRSELLNYRLTNSLPWFLTLLGAFQDTWLMGACCSYQEWMYEEQKVKKTVIDVATGDITKIDSVKVVKDTPAVELIPLENIRIDPAADWLDPINSSPYVIQMLPMYAQDVRDRMKRIDPKTGAPEWKEVTEAQLASARTDDFNSVRQAREGKKRTDPKSNHNPQVRDHDLVWVLRCFVRKDGKEWVYYTLGTEFRLTDPVELHEVYLHGERPFAWGISVLETHRVLPDSQVTSAAQLQVLANEIANQRIDNVRLVLNKRYVVRRSANTDTGALMRSVPGGVVMTDDESAVKEMSFPDVTGSAYQEQDRVNLDYDELVGSFSMGSVQSNRKLNETVGGMEMLAQDANSVTEYTIRLFAETWVKRVLSQLDQLEVAYETDENVLKVAGNRAASWNEERAIFQNDLEAAVKVNVNVGFGATNPRSRVEKMSLALGTITSLNPALAQQLNYEEIAKELFGALGFQDGSRFLTFDRKENPQVAQMQQALQEALGEIERLKAANDTKIQVAKITSEADIQEELIRADADLQIAGMKIRQQSQQAERQAQMALQKANNPEETTGAEDPIGKYIRGE